MIIAPVYRFVGTRGTFSLYSQIREEGDVNDVLILFEKLADEDCVVCAHVGGRYADIKLAHDPRLETAMEIHSA